MTRAIIFILLKIVEAAAIVFVPYLSGSTYYWIRSFEGRAILETWLCGFVMIIFVVIFLLFVCGAIGFIYMNLDLSKKLAKKLKNLKT